MVSITYGVKQILQIFFQKLAFFRCSVAINNVITTVYMSGQAPDKLRTKFEKIRDGQAAVSVRCVTIYGQHLFLRRRFRYPTFSSVLQIPV